MGAAKIIKQGLIERDMSIKTLAENLGIQAQSMSNKLYRDNFNYEEVEKIADILGCDVKVITRDSHKEFM